MKYKIILMLTVLFSPTVLADILVIAHPSNNNLMNDEDVTRLFLGKDTAFPDGSQAVPINLNENLSITNEFNSKVLNKSAMQLKTYWSKLVFIGQATPPKSVANNAEIISLVSTNPNLIGYIDAKSLNDSVKVIGKY